MEVAPTRTTAPSDKREAILEAALTLFAERGFHGTAVPLVAKAAGVGAGTIYRYFDSKEALVNALYRRWKSALVQSVIGGFPVDRPTREQFRWFWDRMAAFALEHPRALAFLEFNNHRSYLDDASRQIENRLLDFGVAWMEQAQRAQIVKPQSPRVLLAVVIGAFIGMMRAGWEGYLDLTPDNLSAAEQCCWESIRQ